MHMRVVVIKKIILLLEWLRYIQMLPIAQHHETPPHFSLTLPYAASVRGHN